MALPLRPEEISAEWLTWALQERHPGIRVTAVEILEIIPGTSTKIRVRPTYHQGATPVELPATLIVKGGFEAHSPALQPMYLNGATSTTICPRLPAWLPMAVKSCSNH